MLFGELRKVLDPVPRDLAAHREGEIIEGRLCVDHVHILIAIPPKYVVAEAVGYNKGKSAVRLLLSGFTDCFSRDSLALFRVAEDDPGREHKDFVFIASRTTGTMNKLWHLPSATWPGRCERTGCAVEFLHATDDRGLMSFRVHLPLERAQAFDRAAADGQMGCIIKAYWDWQLSGDDEWLRALWPGVRRALEFCWLPGGWDADRDGVMEGCQHNTMDVEHYGPNPQMGIWYLGALRAEEEMARHLGEEAFADKCRSLCERGSAWIDANLFNGEYYEHQVRLPEDSLAIAEELRCIEAIRARQDGRVWSPFDKAEGGHYYGRAVARRTAVLALTRFRWSDVIQSIVRSGQTLCPRNAIDQTAN